MNVPPMLSCPKNKGGLIMAPLFNKPPFRQGIFLIGMSRLLPLFQGVGVQYPNFVLTS